MLDKLAGVAARYEEIENLLGDPAVASNYQRVAELSQERSSLQPITEGYYEYRIVLDQIDQARSLLEGDDADMRDLTNFMVYLGEPAKLVRYRIGIYVLIFLAVFLVFAYLLKKEYWKDVH